jgi:hypothetical protein
MTEKTKITVDVDRVRIEFPSGVVFRIYPSPTPAREYVEVYSEGFNALSIRPVSSNVARLSVTEL